MFEQAVLAEFISEGHFARHVRRMREVYAERLNVLLEEGRRELRGVVELSEVEAGLQTVGWLHGVSADAAVKAARARGVDVTSLASMGDEDCRDCSWDSRRCVRQRFGAGCGNWRLRWRRRGGMRGREPW